MAPISKAYLLKFEYGNSRHDQLWAALTAANAAAAKPVLGWDGAPLDVKAYMDPWVSK